MEWMHFLHVISAVTLLGLSIAGYFYFLFTHFKEHAISHFTLKLTLFLDALILIPLIVFVTITGFVLDMPVNILIRLAWIISSCIYLLLAMLCLVVNLWLKIDAYRNFKKSGHIELKRIFYVIGILQIILLIGITHDMVIHRGLLTPFVSASSNFLTLDECGPAFPGSKGNTT